MLWYGRCVSAGTRSKCLALATFAISTDDSFIFMHETIAPKRLLVALYLSAICDTELLIVFGRRVAGDKMAELLHWSVVVAVQHRLIAVPLILFPSLGYSGGKHRESSGG
jgi:hypothetical protein